MEDTTRSGGGTQGHNKLSGIKAQCMYSCQKGTKEELDADEVLCHWIGSPLGYEILARLLEGTNDIKKEKKRKSSSRN
jgi:hypothetical protein